MAAFVSVLTADLKAPMPYLAWLALGLLLGVSGPFGSYGALAMVERIALCMGLMAVAFLVGITIRAFVRGVLRLTDVWRGAILVAVLSSVIMAAPLYLLLQSDFAAGPALRPSLIDLLLFVFGVSLLIGVSRDMMVLGVAPTLLPPTDLPEQPEGLPLPRIVARLEPELQGRLLALTVRNHYVDVYTNKGRGSLLIRLADAIVEAEGEAGTQIHRSHWVAWAAIRAVEKDSGKIWVRLCPELRLPVSKSHRAKLEERGLL